MRIPPPLFFFLNIFAACLGGGEELNTSCQRVFNMVMLAGFEMLRNCSQLVAKARANCELTGSVGLCYGRGSVTCAVYGGGVKGI